MAAVAGSMLSGKSRSAQPISSAESFFSQITGPGKSVKPAPLLIAPPPQLRGEADTRNVAIIPARIDEGGERGREGEFQIQMMMILGVGWTFKGESTIFGRVGLVEQVHVKRSQEDTFGLKIVQV